jgi:uncharacterized membrane protein YphA (DoxX/SURF4 family)
MLKRSLIIIGLFKKAFLILAIVFIALIILVVSFFWNDSVSDKYDVTIDNSKIPVLTEVALPFSHI